jgi:phosphate starvation-inducible PhoH-like protein
MNNDNHELITPVNRSDFYNKVEDEIKDRKKLKGLTPGQCEYIDAINTSVVTLCGGHAGTGKSYISIVRALELFREGLFKKIIVSRPIVECGEELGYLPGHLEEKIAPYMRPILDILEEFMSSGKEAEEYIEAGIVEFCPLAYMRGRTLSNAIMILDEAQNATWEQLKMFITRVGNNSKIIISGDETQRDRHTEGFVQLLNKFNRPPYIDGVGVVRLSERDIVRNTIIRQILDRMGEYSHVHNYRT